MTLSSVNPRTGEAIETSIVASTAEDVARVCADAAAAAHEFGRSSRASRAAALRAIAQELENDSDHLARVADEETALGLPRLTGELARTAFQLRAFAEVVDEGSYLEVTIDDAGQTAMGPRPELRRHLVPLGPVAVFGASNFPFAFSVAGGDTASALAAGCPVVIKGHSSHPRTALETFVRMQRALIAAGVDERVVSLVFGRDAGATLVAQPAIKAVGFTGSQHGGRALFDLAQGRPDPIPFYGELGSVNPLVVTEAAAQERAGEIARDFVSSMTLGAGQFCTKPGLLFVPAAASDQFRMLLASELKTVAPMWSLNKSIHAAYEDGIARLSSAVGSGNFASSDAELPGGFSMNPALVWSTLDDVQRAADPLLEECFGPVAVVVEYSDLDDLVAFLRTLPGALTGAVHAGSEADDAAAAVLDALAEVVGRVVWNGYPTGVAVAWAMTHGGPHPSSTNALHTSVGATAIRRFVRPVTYQAVPQQLLVPDLRDATPVPHRRNGVLMGAAASASEK